MSGPTPAPRNAPPVTHVVNNFDLLPHGWRDPFWAGVCFTAGAFVTAGAVEMVRALIRWLFA